MRRCPNGGDMHFQQPPTYVQLEPLFEPERVPKNLMGLTGLMLSDLHDLVMTFGFVNDPVNKRVLITRNPFHIRFSARQPGPNDATQFFSICIGSDGDRETIRLAGGVLYWHEGITVNDVRSAIRWADHRMMAWGFMDRTTGIRTGIYESHAVGLLPVREVFREPETLLRPPPTDKLALNTFLETRFDEPDKLTFVETRSGIFICLKGEKPIILRKEEIRRRIRKEYYQRYRITTKSELERMSPRRFLRMEQRIAVAIEKELSKLTR